MISLFFVINYIYTIKKSKYELIKAYDKLNEDYKQLNDKYIDAIETKIKYIILYNQMRNRFE